MDVKEAAKKAAAYTADMETLTKPDEKALFLIDRRSNATGMVFRNQAPLRDLRTYKTVTISDDSGEVVSYE